MPTISIIIPCYNHGHYLSQAVNSVLDQTFTNWQVVIVDDGSTDSTREIAAQFTDPRIRYVYQENRGLSAARNTGIRAGRGEYLAYLDADDRWEPDFLVTMLMALKANPAASFVYCGVRFNDPDGMPFPRIAPPGPPPTDWTTAVIAVRSFLPHTVLCRTEKVFAVGLFDENLKPCGDWDLWIRLIAQFGPPVPVEKPLAWYRLSNSSMSAQTDSMFADMCRVIDKHTERDSASRHQAYASAHMLAAVDYFMKTDLSAVVHHLTLAKSLDPHFTERPDLYYEILCGNQHKGHRGNIAELDLPTNVRIASAILDEAYCVSYQAFPCLDLGNVHQRLLLTAAQMAARQGDLHMMRTFLVEAVRKNPAILGRSTSWRLIIKAILGV